LWKNKRKDKKGRESNKFSRKKWKTFKKAWNYGKIIYQGVRICKI
jgi:hypothetical protein